MKVVYSFRSLANLDDIADYWKPRSPRGAAQVQKAITDTIKTLSWFPRIGRNQRTKPVRKLGVRGFPYNVYYMVDEDANQLVVLSVRHDKRRRVYSDQ